MVKYPANVNLDEWNPCNKGCKDRWFKTHRGIAEHIVKVHQQYWLIGWPEKP